ncbi:unnamed protein product [Didymodactylos carnosus]|uniref:Uncharacterized protein n=1 Tax=Didymodactylos carnosus TaxID=1234261 RepID=A0A815W5T3_9BILA|nr:unnamed protein product [Didymodactylos carnosus]CAF4397825.1 unnamed protein product [Didymodactylos carnosus]
MAVLGKIVEVDTTADLVERFVEALPVKFVVVAEGSLLLLAVAVEDELVLDKVHTSFLNSFVYHNSVDDYMNSDYNYSDIVHDADYYYYNKFLIWDW